MGTTNHYLVELNDVWVLGPLENLDLVAHIGQELLRRQPCSFDYLEGDRKVRRLTKESGEKGKKGQQKHQGRTMWRAR